MKERRVLVFLFSLGLSLALLIAWFTLSASYSAAKGQEPRPSMPLDPRDPLGTVFTDQEETIADGEPDASLAQEIPEVFQAVFDSGHRIQADQPITGWLPALICPDLVDFKDDLLEIPVFPPEPGATVDWWFLKKSDGTTPKETIAHGRDRYVFHRDRDVAPGKTYLYTITTIWKDVEPKIMQNVIYDPVAVGEACNGNLYGDEPLEFATGVHNILTLVVADGGQLRISGNAVVKLDGLFVHENSLVSIEGDPVLQPYSQASATIHSNGDRARLEIDGGTFKSAAVSFSNGGGWIRDANFDSSTVYVYGKVTGTLIADNTFTGGFNPGLAQNWIELWGDTDTTIERNRGQFGVRLRDQARATLRENTHTGYLSLQDESWAWIEDSRITGTISVDPGYGVPEGHEATAWVVSDTIVVAETAGWTPTYALHALNGGQVRVLRNSHLENLRGTGFYVINASGNATMTVMDSSVIGFLRAVDSAIDLRYNKLIRGTVSLEGETQALVDRTLVEGRVQLNDDVDVIFSNNVVSGSTVDINDKAKGEFRENTLNGDPYSYALDVSRGNEYPHNKLKIEHNCIEGTSGLILRDSLTTTLVVTNNWWGDASGPTHASQNPDGKGALITGDRVDFSDYVQTRPTYCRDKPPPRPSDPVVAWAAIPPQGGSLFTPDDSARLHFPAGAVDQTTIVTYESSPPGGISDDRVLDPGAEPSASAPPPTGDLLAVRFFDLSAVISGTTTPVTQFNKPYTVVINYRDAERGMANESTLGLYWWDGSKWAYEPTSDVDVSASRLTASPDHMTLFAVLGEAQSLYLPIVLRNP